MSPSETSAGARTRQRHWVLPLLAVLALAYLVAMVVTGALPRQRQLVTFEAAGPLREPAEAVQRIELDRNGERRVLIRQGPGWRLVGAGDAAAILDGETQALVDMGLQMLHNSRPIRHIAEAGDARRVGNAYGLAEAGLATRLVLGSASAAPLTFRFGAHNPEDTAQYMTIDGSPGVYLMSRFVGAQWDKVWQAGGSVVPSSAPSPTPSPTSEAASPKPASR